MIRELSKQARADAIASIKRYWQETMPEPLGDLASGLLLDFFLEEIGPVVYNSAIEDAQTQMHQRVDDLNGNLFADEFAYWPNRKARQKKAV